MNTGTIVEAINVIFSGQSSPEQFRQANIIVEQIKSSKDFKLIFETGSYLIINGKQFNTPIQHFGLQLIESGVKLHWRNIDKTTRDALKTFLESLLITSTNNHNGSINSLEHNNINDYRFDNHTTPRPIFDGLSKCFCEVIKREWPHDWPDLLVKLLSIKRSKSVLFILWRLAEDIGVFNEPPNTTRRREITNGLVAAINDIYLYIGDCIHSHEYDLISTAMQCLTGFISWSPINHELMRFLCQILSTSIDQPQQNALNDTIALKNLACDSLIVCLDRKHVKVDSKDAVQSLFEFDDNLRCLITTLNYAFTLTDYNQKTLELQKKICRVLSTLIKYIQTVPADKARNLEELYATMKMVSNHPSITFSREGIHFWLRVLTNNTKKSNYNITDDLIVSLLLNCANKLVRVSYDSKVYGFDFDCQQDFDHFQNQYRVDVGDLCRALTVQNERICYELVSTSLAKCLQQQNSNLNEWEALASLAAAVCSRITKPEVYAPDGTQLTRRLIIFIGQTLARASDISHGSNGETNGTIPDLLSSQISCLSALMIFLPHWHQTNLDLTQEIFNKLLLLAFHRPDKANTIISARTMDEATIKGYRSLARHAAAAFVRVCQNHSTILLNMSGFLKSSIDTLSATFNDIPYSLEKCQLYEGLLLLCNEESDPKERSKFILELFESIKWFKDYKLNCDQFIEFVGLDRPEDINSQTGIVNNLHDGAISQAIPTPQHLKISWLNRVKLNYVVTLINGITKRVKSKEELLPGLLAFVEPMLNIIFTMNTVWLPEMQAKCCEEYKSVLFANINNMYKQQILDTVLVSPKPSAAINIQDLSSNISPSRSNQIGSEFSGRTTKQYLELFSWHFYETLVTTVGLIITKASPEIFTYINVQWQSALACAELLPPLKLRKLTKHFVMPLVTSCSSDQNLIQQSLLPLLSSFLPFMFNRLNEQWKKVSADSVINGSASVEDSKTDKSQVLADEMVQDQLLRNLSRDFIDLMYMILLEENSTSPSEKNADTTNVLSPSNSRGDLVDDSVMMTEGPRDTTGQRNNQQQQDALRISLLGLNLLSARPDFVIIVMASTLNWSDSALNTKSIVVNTQLLKHILSDNLIKTMDEAALLFGNIITSLGMFGEHEQNLSGLLQLFYILYENLSKKISNFHLHLEKITTISSATFKRFDEDNLKLSEKNRKIAVRKLLDKLIGKNIGQVYKLEKSD